MKKFIKSAFAVMLSGVLMFSVAPKYNAEVETTTISIDMDRRYQTMEGFGFFGAPDVWWSSQESIEKNLDAWSEHVINDLGITMWRNELPPNVPVDGDVPGQDSNWPKQKKTVQKLKEAADKAGVDLKMLLTVWSPPAAFKIATDPEQHLNNATAIRGGEHKAGTKKGGTLNPEKYKEYADWLIGGLDMYKAIGVDVYGLSLQNEPAFYEDYNSCIYTATWYGELIRNVVPLVKEKYPNVKIFGTEEMLTDSIESDSLLTEFLYVDDIVKYLDAIAVHGYTDGVRAEATENHKNLWERLYSDYAKELKKPVWMTETSGYSFNWLSDGKLPGALDLGVAINSAIKYGKLSSWVFWQGSGGNSESEFSLMDRHGYGKKYEVSRHFYKCVRPGTVMVQANANNDNVLATAFHDKDKNEFVSVIINNNDTATKIKLSGTDVKDDYTMYLTTDDSNTNFKEITGVKNGEIEMPANSIITLVNKETAHTPLTFLAAPSLKGSITTASTKIAGTHKTNGAKVAVYNGSKLLGKSTVKSGKFSVAIKAQAPGTKLTVEVTKSGYREGSKSKTVSMQKPTIKAVNTKAKVVQGKAYKGSKITITLSGKKLGQTKTDKKGSYSLKIKSKLKKGKRLKVKSQFKKYSKSASVKIKK